MKLVLASIKKNYIYFIPITVIIVFNILSYFIIFNESMNQYLNDKKAEYKKNLFKLNELYEKDLKVLKEMSNADRVIYSEKGMILSGTLFTDIGTKLPFNEKEYKGIDKNGKIIIKDGNAVFFYAYNNGIIIIEKRIADEKKRILNYTIISEKYILLISLIVILLIYFLNKNHYVKSIEKIKNYFNGFNDYMDFEYYEKGINVSKNSGLRELADIITLFFVGQKDKIKILEEDRKGTKRVFDAIKLKNSELVSLYEFAKTLSLEIEVDKIYERIERILTNSMSVNVIVLMLKIDDKHEIVIEKGITGYRNLKQSELEDFVLKNGKPLKIKEALKDSRVDFEGMKNEDAIKLKEFFVVPLKKDKGSLGVMIIDRIFEGKMKNTEELITLATIGEIIGKAIERGLKYREMNIGLNMASILYKITTLVEAKKDLYEIFKEIIKSIKKVIDYTSASIYLVNEKNELESNPEYREGENDEILENVEFKLGKGIKALAAQKKDTIIIEDVTKTAKGFEKIFNEKFDKITSFACVPMLAEDKLVGVINLTHKDAGHFKEEDKKILKLFANQAAVTIEKIMKDRKIEELIARLQNETITDPLTEIYNRRYMMQRLKEELLRAAREGLVLGLIAIDIDFFKRFNDTYGHQIGDFVLKRVADSVKNSIRVVDIACRYGGEEFFVILPNTTPDGLKITAERVRKAVEANYFDLAGQRINITISIGVSKFPMDSKDGDDLIKKADMALYKAKQTGRNRVVIYGD